MPILKAKRETYEFSLDDIKKLICNDLNVPENTVTVKYKTVDTSDDRFGGSPSYSVTSVEVTVEKTDKVRDTWDR